MRLPILNISMRCSIAKVQIKFYYFASKQVMHFWLASNTLLCSSKCSFAEVFEVGETIKYHWVFFRNCVEVIASYFIAMFSMVFGHLCSNTMGEGGRLLSGVCAVFLLHWRTNVLGDIDMYSMETGHSTCHVHTNHQTYWYYYQLPALVP